MDSDGTPAGIKYIASMSQSVPHPDDDDHPTMTTNRPAGGVGQAFARGPTVLIHIIATLLYILMAGAAWIFYRDGITYEDKPGHSDHERDNKNFYQKVKDVHESAKRVAKVPSKIHNNLIIFTLTWLTVNLYMPGLKNRLVLWKWSLLFAVVLCGHPLLSMVTRLLVHFMCNNSWLRRKTKWVYFIKGIRRSVNLVLLSGSLLLTWFLCFWTSHGMKKPDDTDTFLCLEMWILETLVVVAVLWLFKTVLLLIWEADAVYGRFSAMILSSWSHLYMVWLVCGLHWGIFRPQTVTRFDDGGKAMESPHEKNDKKKNRGVETRKAKSILCVAKDVNHHVIKKMAQCFVNLSRAFSREDDTTSHILLQCQKINPKHDPDHCLKVEDFITTYNMDEADAKILYEFLKGDHNQKRITYKNFENSMVKAHRNCVSLGHTLFDAKKVVKALSIVMNGLLLAVVSITWLILSDNATTKFLVLLASSLLLATFACRGTWKMMFQGIVFSFIRHPFNVGDLCIIDERKLEVKRMDIMSTTFVVVGTNHEASYPNSVLTSKPICNLKDVNPSVIPKM